MTSPIQWNSVSLDRTSHFSSRKIVIFAHLEQHLNAMLGSCLIAIFMLTTNGPRRVITCSTGSPGVTTFEVWQQVENNTFPIPQISRFFLRMRETSEGTSSYTVRFVLRHFVADERFARRYRNEHSPEIPLTLPFSSIFAVFPRVTLTQTTLKITVSGRCACVCACVWLCIVYVVCCVVLYL